MFLSFITNFEKSHLQEIDKLPSLFYFNRFYTNILNIDNVMLFIIKRLAYFQNFISLFLLVLEILNKTALDTDVLEYIDLKLDLEYVVLFWQFCFGHPVCTCILAFYCNIMHRFYVKKNYIFNTNFMYRELVRNDTSK